MILIPGIKKQSKQLALCEVFRMLQEHNTGYMLSYTIACTLSCAAAYKQQIEIAAELNPGHITEPDPATLPSPPPPPPPPLPC